MDYKLELVLLPVADVARAKDFYIGRLGWGEIVDWQRDEEFRVVQANPPGSECAIGFGIGLGVVAEPGIFRGLHLVVTDIVAACDDLASRGVEVGPMRHMLDDGWHDGPHPERRDYNTFAEFSDPDGNTWLLQERGYTG
ncbi:MAG: VOC family protein [Actinobacteria bacterium]|nr:VOC family protein [Actinomycetota bacterium]